MAQPPRFRLPNAPMRARTNVPLPDPRDQPSLFVDRVRLGWMGQVFDRGEEVGANYFGREVPGFDPLDNIPDGYGMFAEEFERARNPDAVEQIRRNIDENMAIRRRSEEAGIGATLAADLAAGMIDPVNWIAPQLRGVGLVRGALKGGASIGAIGAGQEAVRTSLDATATWQEGAFGAVASVALGGVIGGVAGSFAKPLPRAGFNKMVDITLQTESRNRDFDSAGRVVTSPKGARGRMQVMPGTERDPGFGVKPAQNDSMEELARVGRDYLAAMMKRYGNDPMKAWAAYNGGPGTLDKALKGGGNWLSRMPKETRDYVAKNMRALGGEKAVPPQRDPNPAEVVSMAEGVAPPSRVFDPDGRGWRVTIGAIDEVDEEGRRVFSIFRNEEKPVRDPLALGDETPLPTPKAVMREMELGDILMEPPLVRAADSPDVAPPRPANDEPLAKAEAKARIIALEEGDKAFFEQFGKEGYKSIINEGLVGTTLAELKRVSALLADEMDGDAALARAFFGEELPKRVTKTGVYKKLESIRKQRLEDIYARANVVPKDKVNPTTRSRDYDPEAIRSRAQGILDWVERARNGDELVKSGRNKGQPYDEAFLSSKEMEALDMLDGMTASRYDDAPDFGTGPENPVRFVGNDNREVLQTPDEAIIELKRFDREKAKADLDVEDDIDEAVPELRPLTQEKPAPVIRDEVIEEALDDADRSTLAKAYGRPAYDELARRMFADDLLLAINRGLDFVGEKVRHIVKKVQLGLMAALVVFNPVALQPPPAIFGNSTINTFEAVASVPTDVRLSPTAARVYEHLSVPATAEGRGFVIADKPNGTIHVFGKDGRHIVSGPALYGVGIGDELATPTGTSIAARSVQERGRVTPAGEFRIKFEDSDFVGGKIARLYKPGNDDGMEVGGVAIHSVFLGNAAENRLGRLASAGADDNRISAGCINTSEEAFVKGMLPHMDELENGAVFTIPENPKMAGSYFDLEGGTIPVESAPLKGDRDLPDVPGAVRGERAASQTMKRGGRRRKDNAPTREEVDEAFETRAPDNDPEDLAARYDFDADGAMAAFAEKPWTAYRVGDETYLPEGAFKTPDEWLNFVFLRAREEHLAPRREGEAFAEFDARINNRALDEMKAGNAPMAPERDTVLKRLILAPTPRGRFISLIEDAGLTLEDPDINAIAKDFAALGDDMAAQTVSARLGGAATPGGSVYQRQLRHYRHLGMVRFEIRKAWNAYLTGQKVSASPKANEVDAMLARLTRKAQRQGKLTLPEFRKEAFRAVAMPDAEDLLPEAKSAGLAIRRAYDAFGKELKDVGITDSGKRLKAQRASLEDKIARFERELDRALPEDNRLMLQSMIDGWRRDLDAIAEVEAQPLRAAGQDAYDGNRIWNTTAMREDREGWIEAVKLAYLDDMVRSGEPRDSKRALAQAEGAYRMILGEPDGEFMVKGSRAGSLKSRTVPISNAKAWKWIHQDPELLLGIYTRRVAPQIEMARRYGDPMALDHVDEMKATLLAKGLDVPTATRIVQVWEDVRDRILGRVLKNPHRWDARTAAALKNYSNLTTMGRTIFTQLNDAFRMVGTLGRDPLMRGLVGYVTGELKDTGLTAAKATGEAWDLALARMSARMTESEDAFLISDTALERGLANAQAPFFLLNGMIPWTIFTKEVAGISGQHALIDEIKTLAGKLKLGEDDPELANRLANLGIDRQDVLLLDKMPFERAGALNVPNTDKWLEMGEPGIRAYDLFMGALSGEVRRSVITPGPMDKPMVFDGIFHWNGKRISADNKIDAIRQQQDELVEQIRLMKEQGASDEAVAPMIERLADVRADLTRARQGASQQGRIDVPLVSLPFQLKSFMMASGPKLLHGLLSGRDRAKVAGVMALLIGGIVSASLARASAGTLGFTPWYQLFWEGVEKSGVMTYFSDAGKAVEASLDLADMSPAQDRDDVSYDDVGPIGGPVVGTGFGLYEAMAGDEMIDAQRRGAIRRAVPGNNVVWWSWAVDMLQRAGQEPSFNARPPEVQKEWRKDTPLGTMLGMNNPDLRAPEEFLVDPAENLDPIDFDIEAAVREVMAEKERKKGKLPGGRRQPTAEGALAAQ